MAVITAQQIKAARGLLDWGQEELATAAGLGVKTVRNLEGGGRSPQSLDAVRRAIEQAGVAFIGEIGVKRRDDQVRVIRGRCAPEEFGDIVAGVMARAPALTGGEMLYAGRSLDLLARAFGVGHFAERTLADFLEPLGQLRCLIAEPPSLLAQAAFWPGLACRLTNENEIGPTAYLNFGDQAAEIRRESCGAVWFVVFDLVATTVEFRRHFSGVWGGAAALPGLASVRAASKPKRAAQIAHLVVTEDENVSFAAKAL